MGMENGIETAWEFANGGRAYCGGTSFEAFAISTLIHFGMADDNEVLGDTEEKVHEPVDSILTGKVVTLHGDILLGSGRPDRNVFRLRERARIRQLSQDVE